MENVQVQKDLVTIKSFFHTHFFYPMLRSKFIFEKGIEIILLGNFEADPVVKTIYRAKGYVMVGKKLLPLEMYYRSMKRDLVIYLGNVKAVITLEEMEKSKKAYE